MPAAVDENLFPTLVFQWEKHVIHSMSDLLDLICLNMDVSRDVLK